MDVFLLARGAGRLAGKQLYQFGQELHVRLGALAVQRVEAGRLPGLKRQVVPAAGADEDLRAAVLVEEEHRGRRIQPLGLRQQEVHQRGLAGTGLADDKRVAERLFAQRVLGRVRGVEVEMVRLAVAGLQRGHAVPPGIA